MVKLFTIVKDEVDIVRDWIIYHGSMFGFNNIYVIDNYSSDGTYEALQEFKDLIYITREHDYKRKGEFMTNLMNTHCHENDKLAFPIDIDEFIVYHERGSREISVDKNLINNYINNLPMCRVYKANFLNPILTKPEGFNRATVEVDYSNYCDLGNFAKSFVDTRYFNEIIDHGNHINCNDYHLTNLVLVHYHNRNIEQMRKKILNNVLGFGYNPEINSLRDILQKNKDSPGCHHIRNQINILENRYVLPYDSNPDPNNTINITPLKNRIMGGFF